MPDEEILRRLLALNLERVACTKPTPSGAVSGSEPHRTAGRYRV
jgi:hypothetical protein